MEADSKRKLLQILRLRQHLEESGADVSRVRIPEADAPAEEYDYVLGFLRYMISEFMAANGLGVSPR